MQCPATLFNGMINPWLKYPVRGVIWYQGCSNAGSADYYPLLKLMIDDWSAQWKDPKMSFLMVQLAGFELQTPSNRLPEDYWRCVPPKNTVEFALTREIQAEMLKFPNIGLAVAMDVGDQSDIHPRDKKTLGFRLAKEAGRVVYGSKELSQGPTFETMKVAGGIVRVFFKNVGKGLSTKDGKKPGAFAIAGDDKEFVWADAVIAPSTGSGQDGNTVIVSSPQVKTPQHVRYAYVSFRGDVNLCNKDGFPAIPFRSDKPDYNCFKKKD